MSDEEMPTFLVENDGVNPPKIAEFDKAPQRARCWAYSLYGRCEKNGGHEGDHQITETWTDEEVLDPAVYVPKVDLPIHDGVLVDRAVPAPVVDSIVSLACFTCGCSEAAHHEEGDDGEQMCPKHQCREYIP